MFQTKGARREGDQIGLYGIESCADVSGVDRIGIEDYCTDAASCCHQTLLNQQREGVFDGHLADGVLPRQCGDGGEARSGGEFACTDLTLDVLSDLLIAGRRRGHAVSVARWLDIAFHLNYGG